jgi:hypothetical protein
MDKADHSPPSSAKVESARNCTPMVQFMTWCLLKHCIGILSVRTLDPGPYAGVGTENKAAGNWNFMRKVQPTVHADRVSGKVRESDVVMNSMPGYGHRKHNAMSKSIVKIHFIN